jgi:hypothetical protein
LARGGVARCGGATEVIVATRSEKISFVPFSSTPLFLPAI